MRLYGLIGYPLEHSFSEGYFREKFQREKIPDAEYRNFPIKQIGEVRDLINDHPDLSGLNVTIPYKEQVLSFLDKLDEIPRTIGAVNTILIRRKQGKVDTTGFNTDVFGFYHSLSPLVEPKHGKALILGSGGASKAVEYVLKQMNIDVLIISRNPSGNQAGYADLGEKVMKEHLIIINTTPLGTYPKTEGFPPVPYDLISPDHILYDLIYNPPTTRFLEYGMKRGAKTINGLRMLHLQAEKSWEIWNG